MTDKTQITREFWDKLHDSIGTGVQRDPNRYLISEVEGLAPGSALDLGCAQGADAIWLAHDGWRVTAVDVSDIAIERARENATRAGLADRITFARHDLAADFPEGSFDLVSAQFLHSPVAAPGEREQILRRAAGAVAPGGHLLVVSHQSVPSWHPKLPEGLTEHPINLTVQTPAENIAALRLADGEWQTIRAETVAIEVTSPAGEPGIREDHLLHYRREAGT
ncbi:methyltransferase [Acrocarpospora corrugata]|uniref:Methyltransferase n=1 Tax=Acrocarpospora corrugata TaxID=35763 RepID=A0A5M3WBI0_9ACTN|nr:class I SAM-dependent methyltransferase [Acrocarpospora corrugata]GES06397.1 methyltransferase [Acrocarpospora corrugata]